MKIVGIILGVLIVLTVVILALLARELDDADGPVCRLCNG